jgi:uncharacterized membrane protein YcaP (DUF421 family)
MYLLLLAALRVLVRRHIGSLSLMDLLLMVLIADAAQNAMAGEYRSITEGIVLCATLIGWNYFLDWLAYRSRFVQRMLEPPPLPVIRRGEFQRKNMRMEFITEDELRGQLREQGVVDVAEVETACIESDGGVSIVKRDGEQRPQPKKKSSALG